MSVPNHPLLLEGVIQHYAWGGTRYIADLTGKANNDGHPQAELWLGAHPKGPGKTAEGSLNELIAARPAEVLNKNNASNYEQQLPFLFKVLDVHKMLSIQAHPTKEAAEQGFAAEEAANKPVTAADRNYRDRNHKPELGVALTDFYLLHGFQSAAAIKAGLEREAAWGDLRTILEQEGVKGLYQVVMEADQTQINKWLNPLAKSLFNQQNLDRSMPDFWAKRAFEQYSNAGNHDRGIFSIYWFNLVKLAAGQGIFQAAGIPHAYLEGCCVELMANSDNVLRGGLTIKHVDVPQLLNNLSFEAVTPQLLFPEIDDAPWSSYPTPASDFKLYQLDLAAGHTTRLPGGPAIILIMDGELTVGNLELRKGQSCWLPFGHSCKIEVKKDCSLYLAGVGV